MSVETISINKSPLNKFLVLTSKKTLELNLLNQMKNHSCEIIELMPNIEGEELQKIVATIEFLKPNFIATNYELGTLIQSGILQQIKKQYAGIFINLHAKSRDFGNNYQEPKNWNILEIVSIDQVLGYIINNEIAKNNKTPDYNLSGPLPLSNFSKSPGSIISKSEKRILALLAKGMSYKIIATTLNVSFDTVKTHTRNLYRKLETNNSMGAIKIGKELNLI